MLIAHYIITINDLLKYHVLDRDLSKGRHLRRGMRLGLAPVAYLELWRYPGTCTLHYNSDNTAIDLSHFGAVIVPKIMFIAQILRSFTRTQTNFTRACALVGPGVATPLLGTPELG